MDPGRHAAALDDFRRAVGVLRRAGDQVWTARALNGRGLVYVAVGSPGRADADFVAAGLLFAETGQELEAAHTVLNRGVAAFGREIFLVRCRSLMKPPPATRR